MTDTMSVKPQVIRGKTKRPRRVLLYGVHGIGKSSWAAGAPSPLFIQTEDGLDDIGTDRTPLLASLNDVKYWLKWLATQEHDYKTVVFDTVDWLERLIWPEVAKENGVRSIDDIDFWKGYVFALRHWNEFLSKLDTLRARRTMGVILLAHAKAAKIEPPDGESYTRYEPDLYKNVAPLLQEWADEVFFATYKTHTVTKDEGFNKKRGVAIGSGERIVYTREKPAYLAKRRIEMPDEIPLDWNVYAGYIRKAYSDAQEGGNIDGIVVDGSSKPKSKETVNE